MATRAIPRNASKRVTRRYGFPFQGYRGDVARDSCPPNAFAIDSRDWQVGAQEGQAILRQGYSLAGETVTSRTGLMEHSWKNNANAFAGSAICRQLLPVQYPYEPTYGNPAETTLPTAIYTDDSELYRFGSVVAVTSANAFKVLGSDFATTGGLDNSYGASAGNLKPYYFKMIPLPIITRGGGAQGTAVSSGVLYNRCAFAFARRLLAPGTWRGVQAGPWAYFPSLHGTPFKWNKRINAVGTAVTDVMRIRPWGNEPPLHRPTFSSDVIGSTCDGTAAGSYGAAVFYEGDARFLSVMFQFDDGSFSPPYIPVASSTSLAGTNETIEPIIVTGTSGTGTTKIDGTHVYTDITYKNVPIGPPGTVRRIILGTDWVNIGTAAINQSTWSPPGGNSTTGNTLAMIDPSNLKVVGVINNNSDTTYKDTIRDNNSLRVDALAVRLDAMWPTPSRYAFEMERRIGLGYSRKVNPCAIMLAPIARAATATPSLAGDAWYALNVSDETTSIYDSRAMAFRLWRSTAGAMTLMVRQATNNSQTPTYQEITGVESKTLQSIINTINVNGSIVLAGNPCTAAGGAWVSALVPGVDRNILGSQLQPTVFQVGSCTVTNTAGNVTSAGTSPYDFSDVAVGMKCRIVSGAGTAVIPATSVVVKKVSNTQIVLGDANGAAVSTTAGGAAGAVIEFWSDTGDDDWNTASTGGSGSINDGWGKGNVRAFCPSWYGVLAFTGRYMDTAGIDKQRITYTSATPGQASLAPNAFFNNQSNVKSVPATAGNFMGSAPLNRNNILCYSRSIYMLENRKSGSSGEDQDYHTYPINLRRGCTQYGTVAHGDGWVTYRTVDGWIVTDGEREVLISQPLYDPSTGYGVVSAMTTNYGDTDDPANQLSHSCVNSGALHVSFKVNQGVWNGSFARAVYQYSGGIESAGLGEILRPDGSPWPWSAPFRQMVNAMGAMPSGALYGANDTAGNFIAAPPADGTIWKLDTSTTGHSGANVSQMDEPVVFTVFGTIDATALTLTVSASDYLRIPLYAYVKATSTGITGTAVVVTKSPDGVTLSLSGTLANASNVQFTVYGSEVCYPGSGTLYFSTDQVDDIRNLKRLARIAVRYAMLATQLMSNAALRLTKYNGIARASSSTYQFFGSGVVGNQRSRPINEKARATLKSRQACQHHEFAAEALNGSWQSSFGVRAEIYGIEAEYDVLDSPPR